MWNVVWNLDTFISMKKWLMLFLELINVLTFFGLFILEHESLPKYAYAYE